MKFKEVSTIFTISTDDAYDSLFEGGYIKPEEFLEDNNDICKVQEAIRIIKTFLDEAEECGCIELI